MKKYLIPLSLSLLSIASLSEAIVTTASLSNTTIPFETIGTPTGTTVQYTLDAIGDVEIDIFHLQDIADIPSAANQIAAIQQTGQSAAAHTVFWDGLWLLGGDLGRQNGFFRVIVSVTTGGNTTSFTIPALLQITSVDIHSVSVTPSIDANQNPSLPYTISYALAKDSLVTVVVKDSTGTVVRAFSGATNTPQFNENFKINTLVWNGLGDNGRPVALGVYTVQIDARDPGSSDVAITRTRSVAVQSLASLGTSPNETFEANAFVFPNPVRFGQTPTTCGGAAGTGFACFQILAVRNNANITLKIYTLAGDLVRDESFSSLATGNLVSFNWDGTNEAGKKVGRGLYYYVMREEDEEGTLQTVKKFAVIE